MSRVRYPFLLEIIFNLGFLSSCFTELIKRTYILKETVFFSLDLFHVLNMISSDSCTVE